MLEHVGVKVVWVAVGGLPVAVGVNVRDGLNDAVRVQEGLRLG